MSSLRDETGRRFGLLVVSWRIESRGAHHPKYSCRCDCGEYVAVFVYNLRTGHTKSCGTCGSKKGATTHGKRYSYEYGCWQAIKRRCYYKKHKGYKYYGGRGIVMDEEWRHSFEAFYAHIGPCPRPGLLSVDREINLLGYIPGNVRWMDRNGQAKNKRQKALKSAPKMISKRRRKK